MPPAADEKEDGTPDYWFSVTPPKAVPEPEENEVKPEEVPAPEPALEEEPAKPDFGLPFIHPRPNTPAPTMLLVSDEPSAVPSAAAAGEKPAEKSGEKRPASDMEDTTERRKPKKKSKLY